MLLLDVYLQNVCVETSGDAGVSDEISDLECHYIEMYNRIMERLQHINSSLMISHVC